MKLAKYSQKFSKKQIILLSIPVFLSNLAIPLVGIVDTGLMGNLGETKYLAAISIATSVMSMVIWSFGFLRMGTVGIVSQAFGRGDYSYKISNFLPEKKNLSSFYIFKSKKYKFIFIAEKLITLLYSLIS